MLEQPQVRAAVEASYDEADPEPVASAVLSLLAVSGTGVWELPWLAELALPDDLGDWRPAGELVVPGGVMASMVAEDSALGRVAPQWVERWGFDVLCAAGALDGPALLVEVDSTGPTHDLDDETRWWATLPEEAAVEELLAVRDLEQVRSDLLPDLVSLLALPPLRGAVVAPAVLTRPNGSRSRTQSYTAWWLSSRPVLAGRPPRELRLADSGSDLDGLYDVAVSDLDDEFLRALGVLGSLDDANPNDVLEQLADERRRIGRPQLRILDCWLAAQPVAPPARVRAVRGGTIVVVDAEDSVVVDAPDLLPLLGDRAIVPVAWRQARALAERLDLPVASELADFAVVSTGRPEDGVILHDVLIVTDADGAAQEVAWRLIGGELHVDARRAAIGIGRGSAWRDRVWSHRHRRTEALLDREGDLVREDEDDLDEPD
jgi:hypothetical protein